MLSDTDKHSTVEIPHVELHVKPDSKPAMYMHTQHGSCESAHMIGVENWIYHFEI